MIIRFFFTMGMYVVLARWMYAETVNMFPDAQPVLDTAISAISIPTHDKWDEEKINAAITKVEEMIPWGDDNKLTQQFAKVKDEGSFW